MNWDEYPNFSEDEFRCSHTGKCEMKQELMDALQTMRDLHGRPMTITSGYRDPSHPVEARKETPGVHTLGLAADIACQGTEAYEILELAFELGFNGIGVAPQGGGPFITVDIWTGRPRPTVWSY